MMPTWHLFYEESANEFLRKQSFIQEKFYKIEFIDYFRQMCR